MSRIEIPVLQAAGRATAELYAQIEKAARRGPHICAAIDTNLSSRNNHTALSFPSAK